MIKVDPLYRTMHLIDLNEKDEVNLSIMKGDHIKLLKRLTTKIYLDPPLTSSRRVNKKHKLYIIEIRKMVIEGIRQINKELRKKNELDV